MERIKVVACGGARVREADLALRLEGREPDVQLHLAGIGSEAAARVPDALVDALEIAAYAWAADLAIARPRVSGASSSSRRTVRLVVPVRAPALFARAEVREALRELLGFVTDDDFEIEPVEAKHALPLERRVDRDGGTSLEERTPLDEVVLFSGGNDSTAGALEAMAHAREGVALVTHDLAPRTAARLASLVERLRGHARPGLAVAHVSAWLQPRAGLVRERSQGTRAFVWAVLAAIVAHARGARRVSFYENGVVAFGLPVSALALGAHARSPGSSRTAHPRTLLLQERLLAALGTPATIDDPFLFRTKAEVVGVLRDRGALDLLEHTLSCSRYARGLYAARHCGLCAACIDRRLSTLAAGAQEHDPVAGYETDPLIGARPPGPSRALAEAYVRASVELGELGDLGGLGGGSGGDFFARHPDAAEALRLVAAHARRSVADVAADIVSLHHRHAEEVSSVLDEGIRRHARALRTGRLPKSCLLRVSVPSSAAAPAPAPAAVPSTTPRERSTRPRAARAPIRILHLSDFHFSERRGWDQDPVVAALARDVSALRRGGAIDLVAITGDLADRGAPAEYERARRWLEEALLPAAGVSVDRLAIVPGNHDVDRGAVNRMVHALQRDLLRGESEDAIAEVLADPSQRAALLSRHAAFGRFVDALGVPRGEGAPWWSKTFELQGRRVHVAGLDTAWVSSNDEDKGRLLVSRYQAHAALRDVERADVAIALMHHPWDDLAEFDAREVREAVLRRCRLVLRGHLHQAEGRAIHRPDLAALELACGACYAGSKYPNAYHLVELDLGAQSGVGAASASARVHMRTWDGHDWIADRNAYRGKAPDGVATFSLGA
jgi:7-cyano-7-deazaguanine synthase in queuosine biosynthesis/predicted MPP superfamily phosphohydrolase